MLDSRFRTIGQHLFKIEDTSGQFVGTGVQVKPEYLVNVTENESFTSSSISSEGYIATGITGNTKDLNLVKNDGSLLMFSSETNSPGHINFSDPDVTGLNDGYVEYYSISEEENALYKTDNLSEAAVGSLICTPGAFIGILGKESKLLMKKDICDFIGKELLTEVS